MTKFICSLCEKKFKYESTYVKHKNRKTLCISGKRLKKIEENAAYILLSLNKKRRLRIILKRKFY
jgi:hypothetical protein